MNIANKEIQWVLNKAAPDIVLSKQSIMLDSDNLTDTFTITTNSTGNLSVTSSDDSIATVYLSGNTVTIEGLANGTTTITVNVTENSNYLSGSASLLVNVSLVNTTLNDNSWETISQISQAGTASNYWSIGDTKEVILNGNTVKSSSETKSFNDYSCYTTILGFDHNASLETNGEHSINFILGKDSTGKDIMFYWYIMNEPGTTNGGWNGSSMKRTTMVELKNCLPSDLRAVLKNVTKYTHNTTGGSANATVNNVTASTEQVFLLSEFEVFGERHYANQYEQNKQVQYDYYKNGNSAMRYRDDDLETAGYWWLRSPDCRNNSNQFCCVHSGNTYTAYPAGLGLGIAPAFVV